MLGLIHLCHFSEVKSCTAHCPISENSYYILPNVLAVYYGNIILDSGVFSSLSFLGYVFNDVAYFCVLRMNYVLLSVYSDGFWITYLPHISVWTVQFYLFMI